MADRAKTLLSLMPTVSSISASSTLNATWPASKTNDKLVDIQGSGTGTTWLSAIAPTYPVTLRFDFGSAVAFDSCLIAACYFADIPTCIKDGGIEYSSDDAIWSSPGGGSEFTNLFGAGAPANTSRFATQVSFTRTSARYWRIRIDAHYAGAANDYTGTQEWLLWDSTLIGSRLDNGGGMVVTAPGFSVADVTKLSNRIYTDALWGLYNISAANEAGIVTVDLGATNYIGGLDALQYYTGNYATKDFYLYTSTDGTTYTFGELVTAPANVSSKLQPITFSRIYSARYLKFFPISQTNGFMWMEWFLYATLTPAAPPDPTSVTAAAGSADASAIHVRWSEATPADDNATADVVFDITRQKDGAGYGSIATGVVARSYVDSGLAAGAYDYKVQARNLYHARTSNAVQSSASVTVPAAAGGGGGGSAVGSVRKAPSQIGL